MEVHCLVKHTGNQLELQSDTAENLTDQVSQADYVAVLCALGEPSSAKTGILNAIIKNIRQSFALAENYSCGEFFQPKHAEDDDGHRIDGILVLTPPIIILDHLGRRVAVILMDVWNNFAESENVYGKLVDFCFQVSSVQVFSLLGPLRQVTWWDGSFEASNNNCSPELEHMYLQLQTTLKQKQEDEIGYRNSRSGGVIAVKSYQEDGAGYFPVIIHEHEAGNAVNLSEDCFNFILKQIFSPSYHDGVCKPSELKNHLSKCVTSINNAAFAASKPHHTLQNVAANTGNAVKNEYVLQAYKKRMLQVYSESPQMFLSSQELNQCSSGFVNEIGTDKEEAVRTCKPHYEQLERFHNGVAHSLRLIEIEFDKGLDKFSSFCETTFASGFNKCLEDYQTRLEMHYIRSNVNIAVENITAQVLTSLHLSQSPLTDEIEILTAKLKHVLRQKLLQALDTLQHQMELIVQTFKVFKSELEGRIQRSVFLLQDEFEEAAEHGWKAMESSENRIVLRSLLIRVRDEAVQEYEGKLRQQNNQIYKSELFLAKQATNAATDFLLKLLREYLMKYGVLTEKEVMRAFQVASDHAKKAFLTAPGFNYSPPWHKAFQSLQSTFEERYTEVRQINLNAIRRWDRALESALRSSAEFYSQQMDQGLPKHKISLKNLESTHQTCADKTVSQFTVSFEVNEPTKMYWKKLLVKNQLQEWKEGYVCINIAKTHAEELQKTQFPAGVNKTEEKPKMTGRKTPPPQSQSLNCPVSNVGVYFGPEIVIFTASLPDSSVIRVPILPFAACSETRIFWGEEALQMAQSTEQLINIFTVLTQPTVPLERPCTLKLKGKSVCLTAEALSVLFFKQIVDEIIVQTGHGIRSCAVALPGLLPGGAMTAVKEAIRLAGFSKVTLVPFTTALAMQVSLSLQKESLGSSKIAKKIVTLYHAGTFLEAALITASPRKLEVKKLVGCLDLSTVNPNDLPSYTRKLVEQVADGDLLAVVTTISSEYNPIVKESLTKAIREMGSIKIFGIQIMLKESGSKHSVSPNEIAEKMAELDGSLMESCAAKPKWTFPKFSYFASYDRKLPDGAIPMKNRENVGVYQYFSTRGQKIFNIVEGSKKIHWHYIFYLNPKSAGGYGCNFVFLPDGSFRIEPPYNSRDIPVHSRSCKLLTFWDQETVKQNVERVVKLMEMNDPETTAAVETKKQEATMVQDTG